MRTDSPHRRTATTGPGFTRSGFTLVELLVVIAIIALLTSLVTVAVFRYIDTQRARNTEAQIKSIQEVLKAHWSKVIDEAKKETPSDEVQFLAGFDMDRARVLWAKVRLLEAFPMTYYEIAYPPRYFDHQKNAWIDLIPAAQRRYSKTYQGKIPGNLTNPATGQVSAFFAPSGTGNPETESAACLLIALSSSHNGAPPINLDLLPLKPMDTDSDGVPELLDGWSLPLAFFRFPTQPPTSVAASDLQAANPATKNKTGGYIQGDPLDPKGLMVAAGWFPTTPALIPPPPPFNNRTRIQEVCRFTLAADSTNPEQTALVSPSMPYYSTPIIVSRGRDNLLGLKLLEQTLPSAPGIAPWTANKPAAPFPTMHNFVPGVAPYYDYPDMRVLDPQMVKDNIYSYKLGAPQ